MTIDELAYAEEKQLGGGFVPGLNGLGENVVPECAGGFSTVAVAKTRILHGSHLDVLGLSKGKHLFQCCIRPWMRIEGHMRYIRSSRVSLCRSQNE